MPIQERAPSREIASTLYCVNRGFLAERFTDRSAFDIKQGTCIPRSPPVRLTTSHLLATSLQLNQEPVHLNVKLETRA